MRNLKTPCEFIEGNSAVLSHFCKVGRYLWEAVLPVSKKIALEGE